jgi:hypothetical protein
VNSSLIGKIEKARRYAKEPNRVGITELKAGFQGEHSVHKVEYRDGQWQCSCGFFSGFGTCSHTMAMQRMLGEMMAGQSDSVTPSEPKVASL